MVYGLWFFNYQARYNLYNSCFFKLIKLRNPEVHVVVKLLKIRVQQQTTNNKPQTIN
jgi:hypothetical protein